MGCWTSRDKSAAPLCPWYEVQAVAPRADADPDAAADADGAAVPGCCLRPPSPGKKPPRPQPADADGRPSPVAVATPEGKSAGSPPKRGRCHRLGLALLKWAVPVGVNGACLFTCMWFLHVATYFYVAQMVRQESSTEVKHGAQASPGPYGDLSPGLHVDNVSYGSLEDPLEGYIGYHAVNIHILDNVAALFPLLWGGGVLLARDLQLWTRVMFCNALLAIGKGVIGMLTIVPDSSGWSNCKDRLGAANLEFFQDEVPSPFAYGLTSTMSALLRAELFGPHGDRYGSGMRWCADMMYSGHTYFTCLYGLALVELVWRLCHKYFPDKHCLRRLLVFVISCICIAQQAIEIYLVLIDRFHYTTDIVVAVLMTLLWYTNTPLMMFSKWWDNLCEPPEDDEYGSRRLHLEGGAGIPPLRLEGDVWIPPCCAPFWCFTGYHHLISTEGAETHKGRPLADIISSGLQSRASDLGQPLLRAGPAEAPEGKNVGLPPNKGRCHRLGLALLKWAVPVWVNGACLFTCMWFLHVATYFYVAQMVRQESSTEVKHGALDAPGPYGDLSPGLHVDNVSYGSLEDPLEGYIGYHEVNIHILDGVAALFPLLWGGGVLVARDLQLWTRVLFCNALLAIGKGVIGMLTIVPDSSGWSNCKDRLGASNLEFFRDEVPSPFTYGLASTMRELLGVELFGPRGDRYGSGMRYCADMMYSGHTYFTCLYGLALVELVWRFCLKRFPDKHCLRRLLVFVISCICIAQQAIEIYLVLIDRFHYTTDIVVAVLMTLLWYTNAPLMMFSKWWDNLCEPPEGRERGGRRLHLEGDVWIPPCCVPFCCFTGYHHIVSTAEAEREGAMPLADISSSHEQP